jgi:hypothetical protein
MLAEWSSSGLCSGCVFHVYSVLFICVNLFFPSGNAEPKNKCKFIFVIKSSQISLQVELLYVTLPVYLLFLKV